MDVLFLHDVIAAARFIGQRTWVLRRSFKRRAIKIQNHSRSSSRHISYVQSVSGKIIHLHVYYTRQIGLLEIVQSTKAWTGPQKQIEWCRVWYIMQVTAIYISETQLKLYQRPLYSISGYDCGAYSQVSLGRVQHHESGKKWFNRGYGGVIYDTENNTLWTGMEDWISSASQLGSSSSAVSLSIIFLWMVTKSCSNIIVMHNYFLHHNYLLKF